MQRIFLLLIIFISIASNAQEIRTTYTAPGRLKTDSGEEIGKVGSIVVAGNHTIPLISRRSADGKIDMWRMTVTGRYASFDNNSEAALINIDEVINAGVMFTNIRTIGNRWNMVLTGGITLNTTPDYIRLNCVSLTVGTLFMYRVNKELNIGAGAVTTTAYGQPIVIPAPFITWQRDGKFKMELNMQGMPKFSISTELDEKNSLSLVPFSCEHITAVVNKSGENFVYANNAMQATMSLTHKFNKHLSLEAGAGYVYRHTIRYQERSFKAFWENLFDGDTRMKIKPSATLSLSLKYKL